MEDNKNSGAEKPIAEKGFSRSTKYIFGIVGVVYLLYPSFGLFELIPDSIPVIGSLDEAAATMLVWYAISEFVGQRKEKKANKADKADSAKKVNPVE